MSGKLVSVIVPVYNSATTLPRCIESVLSQSHREIEVILINDGSTDRSGEICLLYSMGDNRVRYFNRRNHGVSLTRQFGLEHATGGMIIGADSDDYMEPRAIELLVGEMERGSHDMVIGDFIEHSDGGSILREQKPSAADGSVVLGDILGGRLHGAMWNKLIRVSSIRESGARFPSGINYCEDVIFLSRLLQSGVKVGYLPGTVYNYDYPASGASISRSYSIETFRSRVESVRLIEEITRGRYPEEMEIWRGGVMFEAFINGLTRHGEVRRAFDTRNGGIRLTGQSLINRMLYQMSVRMNGAAGYRLYEFKNRIKRIKNI